MKNGKAANARYIGPMTEAVAQELRAELARQKRSAKSLAEEHGLNRSTLHKTLNAQRAIDVDDLFALADLLHVSPTAMFAKAEAVARDALDDEQLIEERLNVTETAVDVGGTREDYDLVANESIDEKRDEHDADYDHA